MSSDAAAPVHHERPQPRVLEAPAASPIARNFALPQRAYQLLALQRRVGNQATLRLLQAQGDHVARRSPVAAVPLELPGRQATLPPVTGLVSRCGGEVHDGCDCARADPRARVGGAEVGVSLYVQRDALHQSISADYGRGLSDGRLDAEVKAVRRALGALDPGDGTFDALKPNLTILENEMLDRSLKALDRQTDGFDPASPQFTGYVKVRQEVEELGGAPPEPEGIMIPGDQIFVLNDAGAGEFLSGGDLFQIDDDVFPLLEGLAGAVSGGPLPDVGNQRQALVWDDGRALLAPSVSGSFASLLTQGRGVTFDDAEQVSGLDMPWQKVRSAGAHSLMTSGLYQLGSHPISQFNGMTFPKGTRVRFAEMGRLAKGQMDSRLISIFEPGTKRYYAFDAHWPVPGAKITHDFYHINRGGMHAQFQAKGKLALYGAKDHAAIPPSLLGQAKGLRYLRIGGRVLLVVGIIVDGALLVQSARESAQQGSAKPLVAQAIRTVGGWAGAWAGAKVGCAVGAAVGVETGPGMVLTCLAGGVIGGFAAYLASDAVADLISPD